MCDGCTRSSLRSSVVFQRCRPRILYGVIPRRHHCPRFLPPMVEFTSGLPWLNFSSTSCRCSSGFSLTLSSSVLRHLHGSPRHLPSSRPPAPQTPEAESIHGPPTRSSLGTGRRERVIQQLAGASGRHKLQSAVNVRPYGDELLVCWGIPNVRNGSAKGRRIRLMVYPQRYACGERENERAPGVDGIWRSSSGRCSRRTGAGVEEQRRAAGDGQSRDTIPRQ